MRELDVCRRSYGAIADHLPELIAVRAGLKQVSQITLHEHHDVELEVARAEKLCAAAGLSVTRFSRGGQHKLLLSRSALVPPGPGEDENKGNWFSYPRCCVAAYLANPVECYFVRQIGALVAHERTIDYRLNPLLLHTPFHLLRHLPCSMKCEPSLQGVRRLQALLEAQAPALAAGIVRWNRRPALFLDICGIGILFEGELEHELLRYEDLLYLGEPRELAPWSPRNTGDDLALFESVVAALGEGDRATLERDVLTIQRGAREVRRFVRPGHLTWRLLRFA